MTSVRSKAISAAAALAAVLFVVQIAPRLPGGELLDGFPGGARFDYASRFPGAFPPLSSDFISSVFGPGGSSPGSGGSGRSSGGLAAGRASDGPGTGPRIDHRHALTNDRFERAIGVSGVPYTARTDADGAERQAGEPTTCSAVERTIWYRYEPTRSTVLIASTIGTSGPSALGVFTGSSVRSLEQVGCRRDARGNAQVSFNARAGRVYHFQVGVALGGPTVFNLDRFGVTSRLAADRNGGDPDDTSAVPIVSSDGRYVAFTSYATDMDHQGRDDVCPATESDRCRDAFLLDRTTGRTEIVSIDSRERAGNGWSHAWGLSDDGRYVLFASMASNLVPGDTNGWMDFFVRDRVRGTTRRISVRNDGSEPPRPDELWRPGTDQPRYPQVWLRAGFADSLNHSGALSRDGSTAVFATRLALSERDSNDVFDIYAYDMRKRTVEKISRSWSGGQTNDWSWTPSVSDDGRMITFDSAATNVTRDDTNGCLEWIGCIDTFVVDRRAGHTSLVSLSPAGKTWNNLTFYSSISGDGRFVAFSSLPQFEDRREIQQFYVRDLKRRTTRLISHAPDGSPAVGNVDNAETTMPDRNLIYGTPRLSRDGRLITYASAATNIDPTDTNGAYDVFVYDRLARTNVRVSLATDGTESTGRSFNPDIAADGSLVVFTSLATEFDRSDGNTCAGHVPSCGDLYAHTLPAAR